MSLSCPAPNTQQVCETPRGHGSKMLDSQQVSTRRLESRTVRYPVNTCINLQLSGVRLPLEPLRAVLPPPLGPIFFHQALLPRARPLPIFFYHLTRFCRRFRLRSGNSAHNRIGQDSSPTRQNFSPVRLRASRNCFSIMHFGGYG